MTGMLMNYTYKSADGSITYTGQVVADNTPGATKYAYQPGQTYAAPGGGSYTIANSPGTVSNAPLGSVYQSTYTAGGKNYDTYHYDPATNTYYDVNVQKYEPSTGRYTPPAGTPNVPSGGVPMWSSDNGLGTEYAYIKTPDGSYHVYGGGSTAHAMITPSTTGIQMWDFKYVYADGTYYLGRVVDDGTYGYKVGYTQPVTGGGTYTIYAKDTNPIPSGALAGMTYVQLYHEGATGDNIYPPADIYPNTQYYQKPDGYGGMGSEEDYMIKGGQWYKFDPHTEAASSTPTTVLPLPT